jgi:hypothetical protein
MTRSIIAVIACGVLSGALAGTGGCSQSGVGDPCIPEQEYDQTFTGFALGEVGTESKSFQCQTRLCLVNHFQGRVTCPYGQESAGKGLSGATEGCTVPGDDTKPIVGTGGKAEVSPQCRERKADQTVYCSCRCQNLDGKTDDGANYCACPEGFECKQLRTSIGAGDTGLTGGYCIKKSTEYDTTAACTACDATKKECGTTYQQ